jgi:hypothetical protein
MLSSLQKAQGCLGIDLKKTKKNTPKRGGHQAHKPLRRHMLPLFGCNDFF